MKNGLEDSQKTLESLKIKVGDSHITLAYVSDEYEDFPLLTWSILMMQKKEKVNE